MQTHHHSALSSCRACDAPIEPFMSFGKMPIANGFLTESEIAGEYFFELAPAFCEQCGMFQIVEQPEPEKMFHEQYAFYSSTSRYMQAHFERFAKSVIGDVLDGRPDPFVVELGSNDGIMLRHFKSAASVTSASSPRSMSPTSRASAAFARSARFSIASLPTTSWRSTVMPTLSWPRM